MSVRVDTPRRGLRLAIGAYGLTLGTLMAWQYRLVQPLVRFEIHQPAPIDGPCIYASWHENVSLLLLMQSAGPPGARLQRPQVWLQHPVWFMRPVHVLLGRVGIDDYILGSSGHDGLAAARELAAALGRGASTTIFPDGPAGPARSLHKGVLHLARDCGLPVVPIRFATKRCPRMRGWDRKYWPVWGSEIDVAFGNPMRIETADLDSAATELAAALSAPPSGRS